jgi:hypothetical protein
MIERIVEMRESPPEHLQRVPGPKALLYSLPRDAELQALGAPLPRSTKTIWKILRQQGCILDEPIRRHNPLEPREPLEEVQLDFKDASTVPADPEGKQQHVVEVLNFVDAGTSILLKAQAHQDFHAETAFEAVVQDLANIWLACHADLRPRSPLGWKRFRTRFPFGTAPLLVVPGHRAERVPATATRPQLLRRTIP